MKHTSIRLLDSPIEIIESKKVSPFISKVQIKVCYVGDDPNRNRSIITKDVAREMAPSLRGCPIVGFYAEDKEDFEEHNRRIDISNGEWRITDTTVPYGFVDLHARLWFAKYLDDDENEHEYLCTEGYIWDHAYPEAKRILTLGNNHSMELDQGTLDASWTKDKNGKPQFFIINEAFISKLCILGEECEPCFEGSQITEFSLILDESFQNKLFSMMNELQDLLKEGGTKVFTEYAVEIGDQLWCALYDYLATTYPQGNESPCCSKYAIEGIYEENAQKFAILADRGEHKYYRLNFSLSDEAGFVPSEALIEVTKTFTPSATAQFAAEEVEAYAAEYIRQHTEETADEPVEETPEGEPEEAPASEEEPEEPAAAEYNLEDIPEYVQLRAAHEELQNQFAELTSNVESLTASVEAANNELASLRQFKVEADREAKKAMIAKFYKLSDEDKQDVIDNIDTYSLDDIEAKLSVLYVRNRISFDDDKEEVGEKDTTFTLTDDEEDSATPAWVKLAQSVAKNMK